MTTFHIDANNKIIPDAVIPGTVTKTDIAPESGKQKWNGTGWDAKPPGPPPRPDNVPMPPLVARLRELGLDL